MQNRYDFVYLFDVTDGNPNGDPDAGNLPRVDPETGHGLVTDVCLKRKIRNYVELTKEDAESFHIYVKEKAVLNEQHALAYKACDLSPNSKRLPKEKEDALRITNWMCGNFYDIRTFGAVMTTEVNCGQVRGPVQLAFARSLDPIVSLEHAITRMAVTTEAEAEKQQGGNQTMGRKFTIPYGLYRAHGFVSPRLAGKTGFDDSDLELLWKALENMFDHDRSAARGLMAARSLVVFKHDSDLGNAPAHQLFERVQTSRRQAEDTPARKFDDYNVTINKDALPTGVQILELI